MGSVPVNAQVHATRLLGVYRNPDPVEVLQQILSPADRIITLVDSLDGVFGVSVEPSYKVQTPDTASWATPIVWLHSGSHVWQESMVVLRVSSQRNW